MPTAAPFIVPPTDAPADEAAQGEREIVLRLLAAASFLIFFQSYLLAPLIPSLAAELHASEQTIGLLVPAYLLPYGFSTLVYGPVSDRAGRRPVLLALLAVMVLVTLGTATARSAGQLLAWRVAAGVGTGGIIPIGLALLADLFPYATRGRAIGWVFGAIAGGMAFGSTLGAILNPLVGWRATFAGLAVANAVVLALAWKHRATLDAPEARDEESKTVPSEQSQAIAIAGDRAGTVRPEHFAPTSNAGPQRSTTPRLRSPDVAGDARGIDDEPRLTPADGTPAPDATPPARDHSLQAWLTGYRALLLSPRGARAYGYILLNGMFHAGIFAWLGVYFRRRYGLGDAGIGLALLGYGVPGMLLGPTIGHAADRLGRRRLIPAGFLLSAATAAALALRTPVAVAALAVTLLSLGLDLTHPLLAGIITSLDPRRRGQAMGLNAFVLFTGMGSGSLAFQALLGRDGHFALALSAFAVAALAMAAMAVPLFRAEGTGSDAHE